MIPVKPDEFRSKLHSAYGSDTVRAKVLEITEEGTTNLGEIEQAYQVFDVEIMEGKFKGEITSVDYGLRQITSIQVKIQPSEVLLVSVGRSPGYRRSTRLLY